MTDHTSESPDGGWWEACGHDGGDGVFGICPTCYRDRMTRLMCYAQGLAVPCCGKFDTCKVACVPRGREEGKREMLAEVAKRDEVIEKAAQTMRGLIDRERFATEQLAAAEARIAEMWKVAVKFHDWQELTEQDAEDAYPYQIVGDFSEMLTALCLIAELGTHQ